MSLLLFIARQQMQVVIDLHRTLQEVSLSIDTVYISQGMSTFHPLTANDAHPAFHNH